MSETTTSITVELNGKPVTVSSGLTLGQFLDSRGVERRMIAVEYNREILPRHQYDETELRDGDKLEIVQMVGGG